ncbi:MAG TPA: hypothetical protein VG758_24835 [Hyphomicrobiaceae bacterium]|jgi:hypothetical protein|nr:hypothetical protein [Hyphomicrobiaceae bacterium]
MVTRNVIARIQQRIEAAVARLDPEPPKPQLPSPESMREMAMRFGATRKEAEARVAAAGREPIAAVLRRLEEAGRKKAP